MRRTLVPALIVIFVLLMSCFVGSKPNAKGEQSFDNFGNGTANSWTVQKGSWTLANGEYLVSVGVVENGVSTVNGLGLSDCVIDTKLRFTDSVGFRAGIVFRYSDYEHYYALEMSNEYDKFQFIKYIPQNPDYGTVLPLTFGSEIMPIYANTDYELRVVASGSHFDGYLNGNKIISATDDSYASGLVGLRARRADVSFDNFGASGNLQAFPAPMPTTTPMPTSTPSSSPANSGLIAWWKLNEGSGTTVFDSSGNNCLGTLNGCTWVNGGGTSCLSYNGQSDYVNLPSIDLMNLNSLTIVSWIHSDLSKVGFIIYHGNLGEFELGIGDLGEDTQRLNLNPDHAGFNVKLSDSSWLGTSSSFAMQPNTWHQIIGVWNEGNSLKIYVDGILGGENDSTPNIGLFDPSSGFPDSLGIYAQNSWGQSDWFKGQMNNVMIYGRALSGSEIKTLYDSQLASIPSPTSTSTPVPISITPNSPSSLPAPTISASCISSTSSSSFNVEITGNLAFNGVGLSGAPVLISYTTGGSSSWQILTGVTTRYDGSFLVAWHPSVSGDYMIKAAFAGDFSYSDVSTTVNLSIMPCEYQNAQTVFSLASNSTLSDLAFNSTSRVMAFTVGGPSGTTGYIDADISKSLIPDIAALKVYLDGNQLNYSATMKGDSWIVHFLYHHSTHSVVMSLGSASITEPIVIIGTSLTIVAIVVAAAILKRQK